MIPPGPQDESRHIVAARCPNGHLTHFDRRILCTDKSVVYRQGREDAPPAGTDMYVRCGTCGEAMIITVDCAEYR